MTTRFSYVATALLPAVLAAAAAAQPAAGQARPEGTVTGQGVADIKKQPDILRVQIEILAKGKDLKEALAKLKERRAAAEARLTALGASKDAIVFGDPAVSSDKTDQQRQMEAMIGRNLRGGVKPAAKKTAPSTVIGINLRVDLPFKAGDAEQFLLRAEELQEKIKAADLAGMKELQKLSPEEEEIAEENQALQQSYGNDGQPKKGEPVFAFVSKITDAERAKAQAEAFQKAKRDAEQLARAAGADLGELRHLDGQNASASDEASAQAYYYRRMQYQGVQFAAPEAQTGEAIGTQPGPVTFRVTISASFSLRTGSGK